MRGCTLVRVAVIGSFKQHYQTVLDAIGAFRSARWTVTSPAGSEVLRPGIDFVRFSTDAPAHSDELVQSRTLLNIFRADLTYVVAPAGYVGRTTCYEIGRLVQASRPVYFSNAPKDLPVSVQPRFLRSPMRLIADFARGAKPEPLFTRGRGPLFDAERQLVDAR
jgi:hypothetical protein